MFDSLKQARQELCEALDHCQQECAYLKECKDGNKLLNICKTQCHHWIYMQDKREQIEFLQEKNRTKKLLLLETKEAHAIGTKLSIFRTKRKMSQYQVAEQLGLDHSTVSKHEKGQRKPTKELLHRYAQFYQIPIVEIAGSSG